MNVVSRARERGGEVNLIAFQFAAAFLNVPIGRAATECHLLFKIKVTTAYINYLKTPEIKSLPREKLQRQCLCFQQVYLYPDHPATATLDSLHNCLRPDRHLNQFTSLPHSFSMWVSTPN